MKKIIILSSAMILLTSYEANAQLSIQANFGDQQPVYYAQPQGYVMAPDWPSEHYDRHRHKHNDYWARRQQEERAHADNEHRDHR